MNSHDLAAIAAAMRRDVNRLGLHEIMEIVKACKHWPAIHDEVVDEAIKAGDVVSKRDAEDELEEAKERLRQVTERFEEVEAERGEMQGEIDGMQRKMTLFEADLDRLQELIVSRQVDDALHLLRELAPQHQFLSPAAEAMLAGQRRLL